MDETDEKHSKPVKKPRANPVYITPVIKWVSNSDTSDELPEDDTEYKPASGRKKQRKRKPTAAKTKQDDEIAVLKEKINPKTKMRMMQRKAHSVQDMLKRLSDFAKSANTIPAADEETEDDTHLTCSVCMTSFWYTRLLEEHMRTEHGTIGIMDKDKMEHVTQN